MTLHEAIMQIFKDCQKVRMTLKEIADELNKKKLYQRGDGGVIPSSQIRLRVLEYPQFFSYKKPFVYINNENELK